MQGDGHFSLRANLALLGLSWFVRCRAHHKALEQSRRRLLAIEILIPHPHRGTETVIINAGVISADYGVDLTPHLGAALGNVYSLANAGMTLRIGKHLQHDCGPPRVGPSVPGSGFSEPQTKPGWYLFAGFEGRAVARNMFLDGNTFVDSLHVSKEPFVTDLQTGIAVTIDQIRLSYTHVRRSRECDGQLRGDQFGAISVSARW